MAFSITYLQVWQLKRVVSSIHAPTDPHKKWGVHIHMWTPHLKKWGSTDPLDPVAPRPLRHVLKFSHNAANISQNQRQRVRYVQFARWRHRRRSVPSPTASCFYSLIHSFIHWFTKKLESHEYENIRPRWQKCYKWKCRMLRYLLVLCDTNDCSILIVDNYATIPVLPRSLYTAVYRSSTKYREWALVSRVSSIPCSSYK